MPFLENTVVLIPALNEEGCVGETIQRWRSLGASTVRVINNGSIDNTAEEARAHGAEVVTEKRRGYGAAAARGLQNLPRNIDWVLFSSADGSDRLDHAELANWQARVDADYDLIIGDRVSSTASRAELKAVQSFGNRLCCQLIALGWGVRFNDMGSLRLIGRAALEQLSLRDRSFGWNVEMQVRAIEHGMRIVELPVRYYARAAGESKISGSFWGTVRAGRSILWMMTKLWLTKRRTLPQKAALPASLPQRFP